MIVIHTMDNCNKCKILKMELDKHNIPYEQVIDNPPILDRDYPIIHYNNEVVSYAFIRKKIREIKKGEETKNE